MRIIKYIFSTLLFSLLFFTASAQITVKGSIIDSENAEPLIGATIVEKGTKNGTIADRFGDFSITIANPGELEFSYTGYTGQVVAVESNIDLMIKMTSSINIPGCGPFLLKASPIHLSMPAPFSKIPTEILSLDNDLAITPALNRVPGVFMQSGALNTNRITMRGIGNRSPFSTTKIRAYLDDIPLTTGSGETTIEDIDLSILGETDVWKGPTASIYGAGLGGMIHLKTKRFGYDYDSNIFTKTTYGSYGLRRNVSEFNFQNKKRNLQLTANYNNTHSDGFRENSEYDREGFTLFGKLKSDAKNETSFFTNFTKLKAFIPSSLNRTDYEENPEKAAFTWGQVKGFEDSEKVIFGLSHKAVFGKIKRHHFQNKTSVFSSFRNAYESRPFNILDETSLSLGLRTSFELERYPNNPFPLLSVGAEVFKEDYKWKTFVTNGGNLGESLSDNAEKRTYSNFFAQFYKKLTDKFALQIGANLNFTNYDYEDRFVNDSIDLSGNYGFEPTFSPRIGASYQFNYKFSIFGTISHGFSPPTLEETLTPDGNINPEIQPEKGWNFELGTRGKIFNELTWEVSLYSMQINNLLVAERVDADQFIGINAGKTAHNGLEASADYLLRLNTGEFRFLSSYTFSDYKFIDFENEGNDYSGNELTGTAPHNFSFTFDYRQNKGFYGNFNFQHVASFPMRDDNSIYSEAYQVGNLKIGFKKRLLNQRLEFDLFGGIQNVFNEKYASMILINAGSFDGNAPRYYYPGLPRNFYGGVGLRYSFE